MAQNLLVVFGATGTQGGSVINSVIGSSQFRIRGITRDRNKPSAQALEKKGVEVVSANMDDKESVKRALQGAHSVFLVTSFWDSMDAGKEEAQGKRVVDVAAVSFFLVVLWNHTNSIPFPSQLLVPPPRSQTNSIKSLWL